MKTEFAIYDPADDLEREQLAKEISQDWSSGSVLKLIFSFMDQ